MKTTLKLLAAFGRWIAGIEIVTRHDKEEFEAKIGRIIAEERRRIEASWELHLETEHAKPAVTNLIGFAQITMLNDMIARFEHEFPTIPFPAHTSPSELKASIVDRLNGKRPGPVEVKKSEEGAA